MLYPSFNLTPNTFGFVTKLQIKTVHSPVESALTAQSTVLLQFSFG